MTVSYANYKGYFKKRSPRAVFHLALSLHMGHALGRGPPPAFGSRSGPRSGARSGARSGSGARLGLGLGLGLGLYLG